MGVFGDTIYDLLGFTDPRKKLAQALTPASATGAPAAAPSPSQFQPTMAQGGMGPDQQTPPAPPPQPAAYTSGPDFSKMYLDMLNRQEGSDAVDRGMGLLFAGFAQPQDRAGMVQAMTASTLKDPGSMITEMQKAQLDQGKIEARAQLLRDAPAIARQMGMPIEQVIAAINSGAMDDIIKEHDKATTLQASPLYKAQTGSAQAEIALKQAQAAEAAALQRYHDAKTGGVPSEIEKTKAEADKAVADADKARAEAGLVPAKKTELEASTEQKQALANKARADAALAEARTRGVPSEIAKAEADARKADADAALAGAKAGAVPAEIDKTKAEADAARARAADEPLTPDIKNYNFAKDAWEKDPANAGKPFMSFTEFQRQGGSGGGGVKLFGNVHVQVRKDADGKVLRNSDGSPQIDVVQLTDRPGVPPVKVPGLTPNITKSETDTDIIYSVQTESGPIVVDTVDKKVEEGAKRKAAGAEEGKAGAEASRAFEATNNTLQQGFATFEQLEKHPGLDGLTGLSSKLPIIPGTDRADAFALHRQAVSVLYNQAIQSLRGITSRAALQEINQASAMQGRLDDLSQSPAAYRKAIADAKESIRRIAAVLADNAGKPRPDWVGDIKLEAMPQQSKEKTWVRNKSTGKLELQ